MNNDKICAPPCAGSPYAKGSAGGFAAPWNPPPAALSCRGGRRTARPPFQADRIPRGSRLTEPVPLADIGDRQGIRWRKYAAPLVLFPAFLALPASLTFVSYHLAADAGGRRPDAVGLTLSLAYGVCFGLIPAGLVAGFYARAWMRRIEGLERHSENRCSTCGYDLSGNTTGVCPECGASRDRTHEPGLSSEEKS